MREGKDAGIVEWIGMFISILVMLLLSLRSKKPPETDQETMDEHNLKRPVYQVPRDDEEPHQTPTYAPAPALSRGRSGSDAIIAYTQKKHQHMLSASYRLKNALEGFQQRRPIDQKRPQNSIEKRTLETMRVSDFLRDDAVGDATKKEKLVRQEWARKVQQRLRNGLIWSQILVRPSALNKEYHLL